MKWRQKTAKSLKKKRVDRPIAYRAKTIQPFQQKPPAQQTPVAGESKLYIQETPAVQNKTLTPDRTPQKPQAVSTIQQVPKPATVATASLAAMIAMHVCR